MKSTLPLYLAPDYTKPYGHACNKPQSWVFVLSVMWMLLLTTTVAAHIGISRVVTVGLLPVLILILVEVLKRGSFYRLSVVELWLVILYSLLLMVSVFMGRFMIADLLAFGFMPILLSRYIGQRRPEERCLLRKALIVLFLATTILALSERMFSFNLFPMTEEYLWEQNTAEIVVDWGFRSTSFFGHPLQNALCVCVMVGFLAFGAKNALLRWCYLSLALAAVFSFNARGASMVLASVMLLVAIHDAFCLRNKVASIGVPFVAISGFALTLFLFPSFGGRLLNQGTLMDGSAQARFSAFEVYQFMDFNELLFGANDVIYLNYRIVAAGVENAWVMLTVKYGMLFGFPLILLLVLWVLRKIAPMPIFYKVVVMFLFFGVSSFNNSMVDSLPWWIFAAYASAFCHHQPAQLQPFRRSV